VSLSETLSLSSILRNCRGLPDIDAELEQLTVDARCAPERVRKMRFDAAELVGLKPDVIWTSGHRRPHATRHNPRMREDREKRRLQ
jgi:hypothetical protein